MSTPVNRAHIPVDPTRPQHLLTEPGMGYRFTPHPDSAAQVAGE